MEKLHNSLGMEDFLAIARRRKWHLIAPAGLIMGIAIALAYLLPPTYRSEATILIDRQSIPPDLVKTTVTGYVQEQIEIIRQRIVSYENLIQIADKFDLYPELRKTDPGQAVDLIRKNIDVEMVDTKATEPDTRGDNTVTIAFTVAFLADTPEVAQAVAKQLSERYLEENRATRTRQAAEVEAFFTREANQLQEEIAKQEKSLADFKQQHMDELPELMGTNLNLHEQTKEDIGQSNEQIRTLQERANALEAELSLTSPYKDVITEDGKRVLSPRERLNQLTAQYLQDSAKYSSEHPDVIRLRHEISVLAAQSGASARTNKLLSRLTALREQLSQARQQYSEQHPTVRKLRAEVTAVEKGLRRALMTPTVSTFKVSPDNPHYVALKSQLDATRSDLQAEQDHNRLLQGKLQEYEKRLFETPTVEREFKSLSRDYSDNLKKFDELKGKQMQARLAQQLEASDNAERFVLLDAASLPSTPDSPNRLGILLLGGFFALIGGIGTVGAAEYMDRTVRGERGVTTVVGVPPLAVIPLITNVPEKEDVGPLHKAGGNRSGGSEGAVPLITAAKEDKPASPEEGTYDLQVGTTDAPPSEAEPSAIIPLNQAKAKLYDDHLKLEFVPDGTYELIFQGEILEGFERGQVKAEFGRTFNLSAERTEQVFSHPHVRLGKDLDLERAKRYQAALSRLGLKTLLRTVNLGERAGNGKPHLLSLLLLLAVAGLPFLVPAASTPSGFSMSATGAFPQATRATESYHG